MFAKHQGGRVSRSLPLNNKCSRQLREYFEGKRRRFELPLHLEGTPFQHRVWRHMQKIPFGKTLSYKQLACFTGSKAIRAVGSAAKSNPLQVIIPCHRVTRHDGTLSGYAAGKKKKKWLLQHEAKDPSR
jgi:methylated-DNA-[protein]-cysteine S-methyltransferase